MMHINRCSLDMRAATPQHLVKSHHSFSFPSSPGAKSAWLDDGSKTERDPALMHAAQNNTVNHWPFSLMSIQMKISPFLFREKLCKCGRFTFFPMLFNQQHVSQEKLTPSSLQYHCQEEILHVCLFLFEVPVVHVINYIEWQIEFDIFVAYEERAKWGFFFSNNKFIPNAAGQLWATHLKFAAFGWRKYGYESCYTRSLSIMQQKLSKQCHFRAFHSTVAQYLLTISSVCGVIVGCCSVST